MIWVVIGIVQIAARYAQEGRLQGSFWLVLGIGCLVVFRVARTAFTVHPAGDDQVATIRDKQHSTIVETLVTKRQERLARALGDVDMSQDPDREIAKFKWLAEQGAISEQEAAEKIGVVLAAVRSDAPDTEPLLTKRESVPRSDPPRTTLAPTIVAGVPENPTELV